MSSLAIFLKNEGNFVSGYDSHKSENINTLTEEGISVDTQLNKRQIDAADEIVCSSAIKEDNKILIYAKKKNKKISIRGQILGEISKNYEKVIAISGAHGKTTTTAMIFEILQEAGLNPTLHLGGRRIVDNRNYILGDKRFFVTEACEYCDNFLFLHPSISVVTNIEKEHMDYFGTFERELQSFEKFKNQSKIVVEKDKNFHAKNIKHDKAGGLVFDLYEKDEKIIHLHLRICEDVNTENCIYAYRVAKLLGIENDVIKTALEKFAGVKTRFEKMRCKNFATVIFDYAHHPTEIEKTIKSATNIFKKKEIIIVFQPHTFSRTKLLLPQFVKVLGAVRNLFLFKTYSAREKKKDGVSAKKLAKNISKTNKNCVYVHTVKSLLRKLDGFSKDCVLLVVGAGDLQGLLHKKEFVS